MNFKVKTIRDPKYLAWVRKQPCCMCGYKNFIATHHTQTGGMGIKGSDMTVVPLCMVCHADVHQGRKDNLPNLDSILVNLRDKYEKEK